MKSIKHTQSQFSISQRFTALVTLIAFFFQTSSVAFAGALTAQQIQSAFTQSPEFVYSQPNNSYMYEPARQLDANEKVIAYTAEGLYQRFKEDNDSRLRNKQLIPVGFGGFTIFVPTYMSYKQIGSPYVQARYIRSQVYSQLGRQLINDKTTEPEQLKRLYDAAYAYANVAGKFYGDVLDLDPKTNANPDMVWPELHTINGEKVIVPVLYLNKDTLTARKVDNQETYFGGQVSIGGLELKNVKVRKSREDFIKLQSDLVATNSTIEGSEKLKILAGGDIKLLSSKINGANITLGARNIALKTLVHRYDYNGGSGNIFGEVSSIDAEKNIKVRSYGDIVLSASNITSKNGYITLAADGNIKIGTVTVTSSQSGTDGRWRYKKSEVDHLVSSISAKETIKLIAQGRIILDAAEIASSEGHIKILAGMGIHVVDAQGRKEFSRKGKFRKKTQEESGYQTFAIRSVLDAGKSIVLDTDYGDITLKAVNIKSSDDANLTARNGAINLLLTKETDHYSYNSVYKGLLKTRTTNRGHTNETAVHNTIVGGFNVQAVKGMNIEYEGLEGLQCDEYINEHNIVLPDGVDACLPANIDKLSQMEGMQWMADVFQEAKGDPDSYVWKAIKTQQKEWDKTSTTLSAAAMALITIAVAVATSGAGLALVGAGNSVLVAATQAAVTSIASTAAMAAGNAAVDGGDFEDVVKTSFHAVHSEEGLKSAAIAAVTAGALAQLDASFFSDISPDKADTSILHNAKGQLSLVGQATQVVTHTAAQAGINRLMGQGGDFDEMLIQALGQKAIAVIGEKMANKIKNSFDVNDPSSFQVAMRYVSHAGAGCILGAASAKLDNSTSGSKACSMGSLGAVTGELVADIHKSTTQVGRDAKKLENYLREHGLTDPSTLTIEQRHQLRKSLDIGATAQDLSKLRQQGINLARLGGALSAFVAGADASSVNVAAMTGQNAAESNALFLIPLAMALLKAIDLAVTAKDFYDLHEEYNSTDDPAERRQILVKYLGDSVEGAVIDQLLKRLIPGKSTFDAMIGILKKEKLIPEKLAQKLIKKDTEAELIDERLKDGYKAKVSPSGNVGKCEGKKASCLLTARTPTENLLLSETRDLQYKRNLAFNKNPRDEKEVAALNQALGKKTEALTDEVMKNRGWERVEGGSYANGQKGIDHLFKKTDEAGNVRHLTVDSKPIKDGHVKLGKANDGVQLSDAWLEKTVLPNLKSTIDVNEQAVPNQAKALIEQYLDKKIKFEKAVMGVDKITGEIKLIPLKFQ